MVTHSADEIVRLRRLRRLRKSPEPWWQERNRLTAHCPRCAKRYVRGQPGWLTCLECEVNPQWGAVATGEFIAKAKEVFPGSRELPRSVPLEDGAPPADNQLPLDEAA